MSSSQSSQTPAQDEAWDSIFNLDPTTSPFFPHSSSEHDPTNLSSDLDIFAAQPLFLPEGYLPHPNYYPSQPAPQMQLAQMLPYESASGYSVVEDMVCGGTFDAIRGDLDKVIMSVWQLKNDYQIRIQNLDYEVTQAAKAAEGLRKDVDAIRGWVQQVIAFLNANNDPSEMPCPEEPNTEVRKDPKVADEIRAQ